MAGGLKIAKNGDGALAFLGGLWHLPPAFQKQISPSAAVAQGQSAPLVMVRP